MDCTGDTFYFRAVDSDNQGSYGGLQWTIWS
jgi:hypothetical protein